MILLLNKTFFFSNQDSTFIFVDFNNFQSLFRTFLENPFISSFNRIFRRNLFSNMSSFFNDVFSHTSVISLSRKRQLQNSLSSDFKRRVKKFKLFKSIRNIELTESANEDENANEDRNENENGNEDLNDEDLRIESGNSHDMNFQWRALNRDIRWHAFFYASNKFANELIRKTFEANIDTDSTLYVDARTKIYDNIKTYKNQILTRMKIKFRLFYASHLLFLIFFFKC